MPLDPLGADAFESFAAQAEELLGKDGADLAENVGQNLGLSIRPTRNQLLADVHAGKTRTEIIQDVDLEPTAKQTENIRMSFENHIRAMSRALADKFAKNIDAIDFMGVKPIAGEMARLMDKVEYAQGNFANLGPHPNNVELAVPIPAEFKSVAGIASKIVPLKGAARQRAIENAFE